MKEHEAAALVGALLAAFPQVALEPESFAVWTKLMSELRDAETATKVVLSYARTGVTFPDFPEFRRTYLRERERGVSAAEAKAELDRGPALECPGWVRMHSALREVGDFRAFPQQEPGYFSLKYEWPPSEGVVPQEEIDQWVADNPSPGPGFVPPIFR